MTDTPLKPPPSASAQNVAICRAIAAHEARAAIQGPDTLAEVFLPPESRQSLQNPALHGPIRQKLHAFSPGGYEFFIARTAYMDSVVAQALDDNLPQIVFLGAGYDTRAIRFADRIQETRLFELDSPATQERKRALLEKEGVASPPQLTYLALDFTYDDLAEVLTAAGYNPDQQTLFVWEGVSYYLPPATIDAMLDFMRQNAPAGSLLCFDYMLSPEGDEARFGAAQSRAAMLATYTAEPLQFDLASDQLAAFLAERGFAVIEHLLAAEMEQRYLTLENGSLAGQVLDLFGLVLARVVD